MTDPTVDTFNADLAPALLAAYREATGEVIAFEPAGPKETLVMKDRPDLRDMADGVAAVAHDFGRSYWVMQNTWHGFPDPPEFVFVGFADGGEVIALGYFDDWPAKWTRPEGV